MFEYVNDKKGIIWENRKIESNIFRIEGKIYISNVQNAENFQHVGYIEYSINKIGNYVIYCWKIAKPRDLQCTPEEIGLTWSKITQYLPFF